jgi:NADH-quinone oxidoreductase subunit A
MIYINNIFTNQYVTVLICISFSIFLGLLILSLSYFIAIQNPDSEKISAYECGFEPFEDARNKFDVRFYIVAILFIIFDVEVVYLFP